MTVNSLGFCVQDTNRIDIAQSILKKMTDSKKKGIYVNLLVVPI